jgi:hypothetical protein
VAERRVHPTTRGFDPAMAGKRAECDGGHQLPGMKFGVRLEFAGVLTGDYVDHGDPPWRWYLMRDLYTKPESYEGDEVWCEAQMVFLVGD